MTALRAVPVADCLGLYPGRQIWTDQDHDLANLTARANGRLRQVVLDGDSFESLQFLVGSAPNGWSGEPTPLFIAVISFLHRVRKE